MAITVEQYAALGKDANGQTIPMPDAESYLGIVAAGAPFHANTSYIVVTSDADDLIAIGPDGAEGAVSIPVAAGVPRPFAVPRGKGWAVVI
jgi:hypothetical protein